MLSGWVPRRRELIFLASGFCLALLLALAWRYVVPHSSPTSSPQNATGTSQVARPTPAAPVSSWSRPPSEANAPFQPAPPTATSRELRRGAQRDSDSHPEALSSDRPQPSALQESRVQEPYTPTEENDQEALRNFLQHSLQQKIDEDGGLRAILYEAAKAQQEKREGAKP